MLYVIPIAYLILTGCWLYVGALTLIDGINATKLSPEDKPDSRAWVVFGLAAGGLLLSGGPVLIAWVARNWVVAPFNFDEDTLGTSLLFDATDRTFFLMWLSLFVLLVLPMLVVAL